MLESLALERIESLIGKQYEGLHMVGGGIHNELFCQYTANVLAREVWAGPSEASVIGHIAVQAIALEMFSDVQEARQAIKASCAVKDICP